MRDNTNEQLPSELPEPLYRARNKQLLIAAVFAIGGVGLIVAFHDFAFAAILLPVGYLIFNGISIQRSFKAGDIVEEVAVCQAVKASQMRKNTLVVFATSEEQPRYFQFTYPGTKYTDEFIVNAVYLIYFNVNSPSTLISYALYFNPTS